METQGLFESFSSLFGYDSVVQLTNTEWYENQRNQVLKYTQAILGAANSGAATRARAPRSRGCSAGSANLIGVLAAAWVRVRSASACRTVLSIKGQASVISPPMKTHSGLSPFTTIASPSPR